MSPVKSGRCSRTGVLDAAAAAIMTKVPFMSGCRDPRAGARLHALCGGSGERSYPAARRGAEKITRGA
eukprot:3112574-Prymnesium_polylepis.1